MRRISAGWLTVFLAVLVGVGSIPGSAPAQTPYLVADVNTVAAGSDPYGFHELDGVVFFGARNPDTGTELWKSDGTREGAVLVKDIFPGPGSSSPSSFTGLDGILYFSATGGPAGRELWRSDGTAAGTWQVADICPPEQPCSGGSHSSIPVDLTALGSEIFFGADDGTSGHELWASDGTEAGTRRVLDILPGPVGANPRRLAVSGGRLFFVANDGVHDREPWTSDGTEAGTRLVKDVHPEGTSVLGSGDLVDHRGTLFFVAFEPSSGYELWRSDGTEAGTVRVADVDPGPSSGVTTQPVSVGETLFFKADDGVSGEELWASDGTEAGTRLVVDLAPAAGESSSPGQLTAVGEELFFVAHDSDNYFGALWKSDGTAGGTVRVMDMRPGGSSDYEELVDVGGRLFFTADDGTGGKELWRSDGTGAGTVRVVDLARGAPGSLPQLLTPVDGRLVFAADDGVIGREPWISDGTAAGTLSLGDVNHVGTASAVLDNLTAVGERVYFIAEDGSGAPRLWRSDGTRDGTMRLEDGLTLGYDAQITAVGEALFFVAKGGVHDDELWRTDGIPGGARRVAEVAPALAGRFPSDLTAVGGRLFFTVFDPVTRWGLWKSDGTVAGTALVSALPTTAFGFAALGDTLIFAVWGGEGTGLWRSDGTETGTRRILELAIEPGSVEAFAVAGGRVFFAAAAAAALTPAVWSSDGTAAGTMPLSDASGSPLRDPRKILAVGNRAYFAADGGSGRAMWSSDGSRQVQFYPQQAEMLGGAGGELFFTPRNALWKSDGTPEGTVEVYNEGGDSFRPSAGAGHRGVFYFVAYDRVHSRELWASDGTAAGTRLVADVRPGPDTSFILYPTPAGGTLYFSANDGTHGQELWALRAACQEGPTSLCLHGRFRVEVTWTDFHGATGAGKAKVASADTGSFWFFSEPNVELVVKVLDGRALTGHWWVFYGSLSNVAFELTVTDVETGLLKTYSNPPGSFASAGDVLAFPDGDG